MIIKKTLQTTEDKITEKVMNVNDSIPIIHKRFKI